MQGGKSVQVSVADVEYLAQKAGIEIKRLAPSWGWFLTLADKTKKKFASNNMEAFQKLNEIIDSMFAKDKEHKIWHCTDVRGLVLNSKSGEAKVLDALAICAPSMNQAIRMLDEYLGCGNGKEFSSFRYKFKKYWKPGWPSSMHGVSHEHGIYDVSLRTMLF